MIDHLDNLLHRSCGIAPSLQSDVAVPSMGVDAIQLTAQSTPVHMGQQIVHSVYAGIGKTR
jgi:hypothetical protein